MKRHQNIKECLNVIKKFLLAIIPIFLRKNIKKIQKLLDKI